MGNSDVIKHYDLLVEENNDPVHDPEPLRNYMDKWDGEVFIDKMKLDKDKSVLEVGVGTGRLAIRVAPLCRKIFGIDISPKTVERAKSNLASFANVNICCGDFLSFDFSEKFDRAGVAEIDFFAQRERCFVFFFAVNRQHNSFCTSIRCSNKNFFQFCYNRHHTP